MSCRAAILRFRLRSALHLALMLALVAPAFPARAGEVLVAVASNFAPVLERLAPDFEARSGHRLRIAAGSTGKLYAQIVHGAPFDVLLAADAARPARLVAESRALAGSRRTYARGRLVLWSRAPDRFEPDAIEFLRRGAFRRLAIANPELAPYGAAAREAIAALGLEERLAGALVMGEDIGQTLAMVATGNAELGFVAASQLVESPFETGSRWSVPASLHAPIRQDAVLLRRAVENPAAREFMAYLASASARRTIRARGYEVD